MATLDVVRVAKAHGTKHLFQGLSFSVDGRDRLGIIGDNGTGKSTLLRLILGQDSADEGEVHVKQNAKIASIDQTPVFPDGSKVSSVAMAIALKSGLLHDEATVAVEMRLSAAGFTDFERQVAELSGGWRKRLAITCAFLGDPDLVLMDEPTNHLDWRGLEWFEHALKRFQGAVAMVTHDRYLLNSSVDRILEIDPHLESGFLWSAGGYDQHKIKKEELLQVQDRKLQSMGNRLRREEEWLRQGIKARGTRARYRVDAANELRRDVKRGQALGRRDSLQLDFTSSDRKTKKLIEIDKASVDYVPQTIFSDFSTVIRSRSIVGLLGDNGSGKSTLLKTILGEVRLTSGRVTLADGLKVVYFDQHRDALPTGVPLRRALAEEGDSVVFRGKSVHVASWASRFGFGADRLDTDVEKLSGGEQARVVLARLILQEADILLLDEPTNDLDISTLEVLEDSLASFSGAVVIVSHDRYLLTRLCDSFLGFLGDGKVLPLADVSQWLNQLKLPKPEQKKSKASQGTTKAKAPSSKKLSYMEQREFDAMEEKILAAEKALASFQAELDSKAGTDIEFFKDLEKAQDVVDKLYARWTELEQKT